MQQEPEEESDLECPKAPPSVAARGASLVGKHVEEILPRLALPGGASTTSIGEGRHGIDLSALLWIGCPQESGRGLPHCDGGQWTEAERGAEVSDRDGRVASVIGLAQSGRMYARGNGEHRCLLETHL